MCLPNLCMQNKSHPWRKNYPTDWYPSPMNFHRNYLELYQYQVPKTSTSTYNVGVIEGGTSVNTIAQDDTIEQVTPTEEQAEE